MTRPLRQLLGNLVTNAAKYGEPGSPITAELKEDGDSVQLLVRNVGPTLPRELLNELFEPLHRHGTANARGETESLDLGLFMVREIAVAHAGKRER